MPTTSAEEIQREMRDQQRSKYELVDEKIVLCGSTGPAPLVGKATVEERDMSSMCATILDAGNAWLHH